MSTIYLLVDSNNIIQSASYAVPQVPSGYTMDGVADSATNATATLTAPSGTYAITGGEIVRVPWFSVSAGPGTLAATLNGYASPTMPVVTFVVAGQTFTATAVATTQTVNGATESVVQASMSLTVDVSAQSAQVPITVAAPGCVTLSANIGGQAPTPVQVVTPTNGSPTVVPLNQADYADYWFSELPPQATLLQAMAAMQHLKWDVEVKRGMPTGLDANQEATWNAAASMPLVLTLETAQTTAATLWQTVQTTQTQFVSINEKYAAGLAEFYA